MDDCGCLMLTFAKGQQCREVALYIYLYTFNTRLKNFNLDRFLNHDFPEHRASLFDIPYRSRFFFVLPCPYEVHHTFYRLPLYQTV